MNSAPSRKEEFGLGFLATMIALAMYLFGVAAPLHAAKFHCSSGDVTCLIAAINTANLSRGPHRIFLDPGTYTLTQFDNDTDGLTGLPSIQTKVTIESDPPHSVTIERDPASQRFRIFHVSPGGELAVRFLRIQHGGALIRRPEPADMGGSLLNRGKATLFGVVVSETGNAGETDVIFNAGDLVVFQSSFEDTLAASHFPLVSNRGNAKIIQSSIKRNLRGGFIIRNFQPDVSLPAATLIIRDSSITENRSDGPIIFNGGILSLTNTTVGNNILREADGTISTSSGGVTDILNSTISGNTPELGAGSSTGLDNFGGVVRIKNSLVALNTRDCFGEITSLGNNLIGDIPTFPPCIISLQDTDLTGDPGLDALTDHGDPGLAHFPLLADSPAIGTGDAGACPITDQLGFFRAATCDIGAVEFQPGPLTVAVDFQPNHKFILKGKGSVTVAILSSPSFDARAIDPETVRFGPNQASHTDGRGHFTDVNRDGFKDLILRFSIADSGVQCGDSSVSISGETYSGQAIQGSDSIETAGCRWKKPVIKDADQQ